jgi:S1-C subfamily serine protease
LTPTARAQEEKEKAAEEKERCICIEPFETVRVFPRLGSLESVFWTADAHPRLGVWVHSEANADTDRYGALIDRVWEGGPADKAGIQEGDIITKLDGTSLLSDEEEYDEEMSAPGRRLVERSRELERGDTVSVEFRRDGETRTVDLVVGEFEGPLAYSMRFQMPQGRMGRWVERLSEVPEVHVSGPQTFALRLGARWPGLELVSLNPQLGEYFGAEEGVLVLSVPEESELNLAAGDVIQSIDGRTVKSPSHAMRILRSYEADEEVTFNIVRKERRMSVTGKVTDPVDSPNVLRIERQ